MATVMRGQSPEFCPTPATSGLVVYGPPKLVPWTPFKRREEIPDVETWCYTPTEEEIRDACLKIRDGLPREVLERRRVAPLLPSRIDEIAAWWASVMSSPLQESAA